MTHEERVTQRVEEMINDVYETHKQESKNSNPIEHIVATMAYLMRKIAELELKISNSDYS